MGNAVTTLQDYANKARRLITGEEESPPYNIFAGDRPQYGLPAPNPRLANPRNDLPVLPPFNGQYFQRQQPAAPNRRMIGRDMAPVRGILAPGNGIRRRAPAANGYEPPPVKPRKKAPKRKASVEGRRDAKRPRVAKESKAGPKKKSLPKPKKTAPKRKTKDQSKDPKPKRGKKDEKKKRQPNAFINFFVETYRREGGDKRMLARECGARWRAMSQEEKDKYKK